MKKKGLIISTVVMVVVLIASLTTATYAWFSTTDRTAVEDVTITVGAGSAVSIGAKVNNEYAKGVTEDSFVTGTVSFAASTSVGSGATGTWKGDPGIGPNMSLSVSTYTVAKAIGTAATATSETKAADASWDTDHLVIKAAGTRNSTAITQTEAAVANTDYIDVLLGVAASKEDVTEIKCNITVNPTDNKTTIGMTAAIHVRYRINDGEWAEEDIYGDKVTNATKKTDIQAAGKSAITSEDLNAGYKTFSFSVAKNESGLTKGDITQLHLIIFMAGYDPDCNDNATDVSSNISIDFTNTNKA